MKFTSLTIALFLISCSQQIDKKNLVGRYIFAHAAGVFNGDNFEYRSEDTLELKSDGTYKYWVVHEQKSEFYGKWKLNSSGTEIKFEDFPSLMFKDYRLKGNWFTSIEVEDNEIHLIYASDEGQYYKKID